jgi:hypothetical protein
MIYDRLVGLSGFCKNRYGKLFPTVVVSQYDRVINIQVRLCVLSANRLRPPPLNVISQRQSALLLLQCCSLHVRPLFLGV